MKRIILLIIILLFLTGCEKTPDEVKNNMEKYNSDGDYNQDKIDNSHDIVTNLFGNIDEVLKANYQNLIMPNKITIEDIISIPLLTFKQADDFDHNYYDIMKLFYDESIINRQEIIEKKWSDGTSSYYFDNQKDKIYASITDNGFVAISQSNAYDLIFQNNYEREQILHVDRGDDTNISYKLLDGKCTVKSQIEYVEQWLSNYWSKYEADYTFRVKTAIIRKLDAENYYYQLIIEKLYEGIPLDELVGDFAAFDNENNRGYINGTVNYIEMQIMSSDSISSFRNAFGSIYVDTVDNSTDKFISLQSAVKMLEKELSGFQDIIISDIEVKYTLCPIYDYIGELVTDDKNMSQTFKTQSTYYPGITITSRPVWAFIVQVDQEEYKETDGTVKKGDIRKYIYIDMITGEIKVGLDNIPYI